MRSRTRQRRAVARCLPDLIDLFRLAVGAGLPISAALVEVAPVAPEPVRAVLETAADRLDRGRPLVECLDYLRASLGADGAAFVDALERSASTGASAAELLDAAAATARDKRRRDAEEAARRLPVTMLLPLTLCVLPAAIVLAVVPVLVVSLRTLAP